MKLAITTLQLEQNKKDIRLPSKKAGKQKTEFPFKEGSYFGRKHLGIYLYILILSIIRVIRVIGAIKVIGNRFKRPVTSAEDIKVCVHIGAIIRATRAIRVIGYSNNIRYIC